MASEPNLSEEHLALYGAADAAYRKQRFGIALKLFLEALRLAPREVETLWAIADCYSDLGCPRKAEWFYRKARASASWSQRGDLLYNLANALFDQGRSMAALKLYRLVPRGAKSFALARRNIWVSKRKAPSHSIERVSSAPRPPDASQLKS